MPVVANCSGDGATIVSGLPDRRPPSHAPVPVREAPVEVRGL